jgi:hypothetical protein
MSTTDVAARLVAYLRNGQVDLAQEELYAENIVCVEPLNAITQPLTKGKRNVIEKRKQFAAMIKESNCGNFTDPIITGRFFAMRMDMDFTLKGLGRQCFQEIGVYEVKNGKIIHEQLFYNQPALPI